MSIRPLSFEGRCFILGVVLFAALGAPRILVASLLAALVALAIGTVVTTRTKASVRAGPTAGCAAVLFFVSLRVALLVSLAALTVGWARIYLHQHTPTQVILGRVIALRAGIRATLVAEGDFTLVGEAASGDEAQRMCPEFKPDVLLLDVHMPGPPAVETVRFVRELCPETKVLILTAYDSDAYVRSLIGAGAVGYVLKEEATQVVVRAIRTVLQGDTWFSRAIVDKIARLGLGEQPESTSLALTERETQVLQLVAAGKTDRQVGLALAISERTVRRHLQSIYCKFGVNTRVEAVGHAVALGLVQK